MPLTEKASPRMVGKKPVGVEKAIVVGLLVVNGPVLALLVSPALMLAWLQASLTRSVGLSALAVAFVAAWLWWSLIVPRWRIWAFERVADIPALKARAVAVGLVWPDGHLLARTEFKTRAQAARERELEAASGMDASWRRPRT